MRFILRAMLWLGIASLIVPTLGAFSSNENDKAATIGATDAASAAFATVTDMGQFCSRQPGACAVGAKVGVALGQTAQAGAKMLYTLLNDAIASRNTEKTAAQVSQDTLTASDRIPEWRGPIESRDVSVKRSPGKA